MSAARVAVKNRMYDTIYVTDAVIQALRAFDQLLGNPQTGYGTIVAENTKLRKLFRFLAGLEPEGEVLMLSVAPSVEVTSAGRVASETDMSAAVAGIFRTLG